MLRKRRIVRSGDIELLTNKRMKPPSVPNDASIMCGQFEQQTPFQRCDGRFLHSIPASFSVRAAIHDHSYHKTLSSKQDVPLSLRLSSFMCNNTKWCKEKKSGRERQEKKKSKRKQKASKQEERAKHRTRSATFVIEKSDKIIRSMSTLQRYTSMDERPLDSRKRRGSVQLMAEFNKRNRVASVDSDLEAHQYRSGASTPTELSLTHSCSSVQMQALMKRKRLADQAYDINNIVIPQHGLTATRIEKLQYKEILTPGWRVSADNEAKSKDDAEETEEDLVDSSYQTRHDRYEILEKKKYVAYMEWSMSKKNGTRVMSRANLPTTSPFFDNPALRDSPSPRIGSPEIPTPSSPDELNIGSPAALVRSRRSSSDHNIHRASVLVTPVPDVKLPLRESLSSEDGRPPRAYPVVESWKERKFPLNDEDFEDLMKTPVVENAPSFSNRFRPIARSGTDTNTAFKYKTPKSGDVVPAKRRRTDSTLSSMSRDDDRHSDGSNTSSYSARPAASRKEISPSQPRRHKPMVKPDFYVYSDIESDSAETTDSAEEEPLISGDDRPGSNYRHASTHWFAKPMDTPSSPPTPRTPTVEQKGPLLLKIKKK
uniref:PEHE domain-containing protein n=1 Tax=Ciona savignyi TaxID=51511 RepID=H2YRK9_CIOSA